jgi:hypothetical protein
VVFGQQNKAILPGKNKVFQKADAAIIMVEDL